MPSPVHLWVKCSCSCRQASDIAAPQSTASPITMWIELHGVLVVGDRERPSPRLPCSLRFEHDNLSLNWCQNSTVSYLCFMWTAQRLQQEEGEKLPLVTEEHLRRKETEKKVVKGGRGAQSTWEPCKKEEEGALKGHHVIAAYVHARKRDQKQHRCPLSSSSPWLQQSSQHLIPRWPPKLGMAQHREALTRLCDGNCCQLKNDGWCFFYFSSLQV